MSGHQVMDVWALKSMTMPGHKLNDMIPEPRDMAYKLRTSTQYPLPRCKTNRYKNSLVPWCLFNCQWFIKLAAVLYYILLYYFYT